MNVLKSRKNSCLTASERDMLEQKCFNCTKPLPRGTKKYNIIVHNSFGDKKRNVYLCSECYLKQKKKSDNYSKVAAAFLAIIGLSILLTAEQLSKEESVFLFGNSPPLLFELGGFFLIILGILIFFYRDLRFRE